MERENYQWLPQLCPTCEVRPTKLMGRRGGRAHRQNLGVECEIWRCRGCGLIFPNPMPVPVKGIEQHYSMPAGEYFVHHDVDKKGDAAFGLLRTAEELTGGKGVLLDIGAGRGEILRAATQAGWTAVGIEPSESFADFAAKHSGAEIRREAVEQCGFNEESFDTVVLSAVLEHLYNPGETIREVSRILRSGGALFLDVPNEEGLYFRIGNIYQRLRRRDWVVNLAPTFSPFHVFGFSPRSLRALLTKHRLRPTHWRVYGGSSRVPSHGGLVWFLEQVGARAITGASNWGNLGTYIETWAIKE